jgi:hypothetical protein
VTSTSTPRIIRCASTPNLGGTRPFRFSVIASASRSERSLPHPAFILAVLWVMLGVTIKGATALYVGEVVAVAAFGLSWFARGRDIRLLLMPGKR